MTHDQRSRTRDMGAADAGAHNRATVSDTTGHAADDPAGRAPTPDLSA